MLFFELFAPFIAVLSVVVAIALYVMERRARHDPAEQRRATPARRERAEGPRDAERVRRPSMLP